MVEGARPSSPNEQSPLVGNGNITGGEAPPLLHSSKELEALLPPDSSVRQVNEAAERLAKEIVALGPAGVKGGLQLLETLVKVTDIKMAKYEKKLKGFTGLIRRLCGASPQNLRAMRIQRQAATDAQVKVAAHATGRKALENVSARPLFAQKRGGVEAKINDLQLLATKAGASKKETKAFFADRITTRLILEKIDEEVDGLDEETAIDDLDSPWVDDVLDGAEAFQAHVAVSFHHVSESIVGIWNQHFGAGE